MKKLSVAGIIGIVVGAVAVFAVIGFIAVSVFRVDAAQAQEIALNQTGGGEIVSQEISNEGLWNEYNYTIVNGDSWYDIEINGFGQITELEQSVAPAR